jgi:hypothetical protein
LAGYTFNTLEDWIELSCGCGEKNMLRFASNIYAATYMMKTGRSDNKQELMHKIKRSIETG